MKYCVVIPTHNEAKTIAGLVAQVRALELDILVVDDGSADGTAEIVSRSGVKVLRNDKNQGKGAALIRGFDYCLKNDFGAVITIDGDGQHLPEDIPAFVSRAEKNQDAGIFIGNRMSDRRNMPFVRVLTNKLMSWFLSLIVGQKIYDSQCGFRLIRIGALRELSLKSSKFEIESEMIIEAGRRGIRIESVPIQTVYRQERSHINPFVDTLRFFRFIFKKLHLKK
jgi:glycosyltransferase involved in cell wall biosynthesis